MMIVLGVGSAWGADYVITYTTNGTTYYLARDNTSLERVTTFNPNTCIWTCYSSDKGRESESTLSSDNSRRLAQTVNGTKYYLTASRSNNKWTLSFTNSTNNAQVWRGNNSSLYARSGNNNGALNLSGTTPSITNNSTSGNNTYYTISSEDIDDDSSNETNG